MKKLINIFSLTILLNWLINIIKLIDHKTETKLFNPESLKDI